MAELSHWKNIVVPQRYETGCIPTIYEWMIRYLNIKNVNLGMFQEEFDLQHLDEGDNSFVPIANKVLQKYPHVSIQIKDFSNGKDKIAFMKALIEKDTPCAMSIAKPTGGWHIVPAVAIGNVRIRVVWIANRFGNTTHDYPIDEIVFRHDNWSGGKDIAWI